PAKPCTVQFLPEDAGRITVLSHAEADALMAAAIADADPYLWLFVAFGLHTGMRHSEITRTKFSEVDFERCRLFVSRAKRGAREQPITTTLRDILRREQAMVADPQGWIFPTGRTRRSKSGHRAAMNHSFRRAVVAAGLDPALVSPHTMRHTAITNLVEDGADIATIMAISGHATSRMVLRYTHLRREHVDKAIAALDRAPNVPKTSPASRSGALVKFEKPG
ncbi:MAG TPA: site-specific integrase, partial [Dongiaceae bacterium]|nr:site-specific integrase [Dongiaceae bacterium]